MLPSILLFLVPFIRSSHPITLGKEQRSREETAAALEKLPWKASIEANNERICGGVILNSWWLLSAAHCFTKEIPPDLQIIVGLKGYPERRRTLDRIVIHQDFNSESMANDIALILLNSSIKFNKENMFISLPLMHDLHMWKDMCYQMELQHGQYYISSLTTVASYGELWWDLGMECRVFWLRLETLATVCSSQLLVQEQDVAFCSYGGNDLSVMVKVDIRSRSTFSHEAGSPDGMNTQNTIVS
ncbi:serine protease 55-like [Heteronotia binoei]|uniref:serine protease 55-like n=1 Tax=Heteronotia binoei TaxID=13085 RepID=UPI00292F5123|nr:serine protease 55-like [Heteronotia binoei]